MNDTLPDAGAAAKATADEVTSRERLRYLRSTLPILWIVAAICYAVPIGLYALQFHTQILSGDPAHWGQFGDYLGGIVNPIIALLTFLVILVTVSQNERLARSAHDQVAAAQAAHAFDQSARQLDAALAGIKRALDLLSDGNNDRTIWIQAARILAGSRRIADRTTDPIHRDMLEIALFDHRNTAASLLGHDDARKPAAFFYGSPLNENGQLAVADMTEAARQSSRARANAPGRRSDLHEIDERTLWVFWSFAQFPPDFADPIGENGFVELMQTEPIKLHFYSGLRAYLQHRQQFRSINGQLFPGNPPAAARAAPPP